MLLDEVSEFFTDGEGEDELQNIEATFIRGNAEGFQMLYLYNPPKNPNAPRGGLVPEDGEAPGLHPRPCGLPGRAS